MLTAITDALTLPDRIYWLVFGKMARLDPTAKSSMLQDLERGRKTEIDMLNGEVLKVHEKLSPVDKAKYGVSVNRRVYELIKDAENAGKGSPMMKSDELVKILGVDTSYVSATTGLVLLGTVVTIAAAFLLL